jgi:hypothetical protein
VSGPHLIQSEFPGDDGRAAPELADALRGYAEGSHGEYAVLPALAASRVLVPVIAVAAEELNGHAGGTSREPKPGEPSQADASDASPPGPEPSGAAPEAVSETASEAEAAKAGGPAADGDPKKAEAGKAEAGKAATEQAAVTPADSAAGTACAGAGAEKRSELALPTLLGADGRRGVLAFTSADALARWRADARPVPVHARQACQATLDEGADALVIDIAGPVPFAVDGFRLRALAEGGPAPAAHEDPDVLAAVKAAFDPEEGIRGVRVGPGDKAELSVRCAVAAHLDERATARRVADRLTTTLRGRVVGGVELGVTRARPQADGRTAAPREETAAAGSTGPDTGGTDTGGTDTGGTGPKATDTAARAATASRPEPATESMTEPATEPTAEPAAEPAETAGRTGS